MQATVSLATTALAADVGAGDTLWTLTSTSGVTPGVRLFVGRELVAVDRLTGIGTQVIVRRGIDGSLATPHVTADTVYIGRGDQFYSVDPFGQPPNPIAVYPYINVVTGTLWGVQGDDVGAGAAARTWAPITTTQSIGALGVRVNTTTVPS